MRGGGLFVALSLLSACDDRRQITNAPAHDKSAQIANPKQLFIDGKSFKIVSVFSPAEVKRSQPTEFRVLVTNTSGIPIGAGVATLSYLWWDGKKVVEVGEGVSLNEMQPGEAQEVALPVSAKIGRGKTILKIDIRLPDGRWLGDVGMSALHYQVSII